MFLGIDGCPAGWFVVRTASSGPITSKVYSRFSDILAETPRDSVIAVDIPIGLTKAGSRRCDDLARKALAPTRSASVFPAPLRAVLDAAAHAEASAIRREIDGKGMSIQSFAITRKVQEIDLALEAFPLHQSVHEVHPELCFTHLNGGQPMSFSKKTSAGRAERLRILTEDFADSPARLVEERVRRDVGADDVLDALVALWSAIRISRGHACVIAGASGSRCAGSSDGHLLLAHFACVRTRLAVAHERLPQCTCAEQQEQSVITGVSRPSTASMSPRAA